ncbi:hypothetical protein C1X56_30735 [Pseudomonas sp. GW101-1A09]|nr:hypothetical protein C1X56_30735 [Pseudomonas sp. GW101-1A09]
MGASLIAMRPSRSTSTLTVTPPSRTGSLPQLIPGVHKIVDSQQNPCGSEPARVEAVTFNINVD